MRFIVTSKSLVEQLQKLKFEVAAKPNPVLLIIEDFLKGLSVDEYETEAGKARIKKAIQLLKNQKSSKFVEKIKRLVFNTKYLRHLKNFFSYLSRTNNITIIRRILFMLRKSPEEETVIYLLSTSNNFFQNKIIVDADKTIGYNR